MEQFDKMENRSDYTVVAAESCANVPVLWVGTLKKQKMRLERHVGIV